MSLHHGHRAAVLTAGAHAAVGLGDGKAPTQVSTHVLQALRTALELAAGHVAAERHEQAATTLAAILRRWPNQPDAMHYLGVLRHAEGRSEEGIALMQQALEFMPGAAQVWNNLGDVLIECGRVDDALHAYQDAIRAAPGGGDAAHAFQRVGAICRKLGRWEEAEVACRQALAIDGQFGEAWYGLALSLLGQQRWQDGALAGLHAQGQWPRHTWARAALCRALAGQEGAAAGIDACRDWLAEEPNHPVAQHLLAASQGTATPARASDECLARLFDHFAQNYEVRLQGLHYTAPQLCAEALREAEGEPLRALQVADVGCGSGLCGPWLRPWARELVGCDISMGMLRLARPRGVYDSLHQAELTFYLETQATQFDVVVASDVFGYVGDLAAATRAAAQALRPGGWLIYTVEPLADSAATPYLLQRNGRYLHREDHLRETVHLAGLRTHTLKDVLLRVEGGQPVRGKLLVAHQPVPVQAG